jgi:PAS domain S-box-containing protein
MSAVQVENDRPRIQRVGGWLCLAGAALGAIGLMGWVAGASALTSFVPGQPPMMPNTALALVLIGGAGALRIPRQPGRTRIIVSMLAALLVCVIGVVTLAQYALGIDLGIDQLILRSEAGPFPGRPSPVTAAALALLGTAILLFDTRPVARLRPSEWLVLAGGLAALSGLFAFLLGAGQLYGLGPGPVIGVAVPTALSLLLTSTGLLLARPRAGFMRAATSAGPGGVVIRRLALPTILAPVLVGLVVLAVGSALGISESALAVALLAATLGVMGVALLHVTSVPLNRMHEDLEASRAESRRLIELAPDGIFLADLKGRYTDVNDAGCRILGRTREELVGMTITDLLAPEELQRFLESKQEIFAGRDHVGEWHLRRGDGSFVPVEVSTRILADGRWQGLVRDISERRRLEELAQAAHDQLRVSEERFRLALDEAPIGMALVGLDGHFLRVNNALCEIVGYPPEELTGLTFQAITHPDDLDADLELAGRLLRGEIPRYQLEKRYVRQDGAVVEIMLHGSILRGHDGHPICYIAQIEDITARKAIDRENARLYREARRAIQVRDEVLGIVAHDLRNPLGNILLQSSLLRRRGPEPERRSTRPAETIERAAKRMNRLIQDLLDVTCMEAGRLAINPRAVSAPEVVCESTELHHPLAADRSIELRLELDPELPMLWSDRDRLLQVLENLLGNAIKFTEPGGRVAVGAAPRKNDVLFWVTDSGRGIDAEDLPHLFDRFWQVRSGEGRGAGLGLPIVKGIVESQGGRVWVESSRGHGSTFFFTVPVAPPTHAWRSDELASHGS